MGTIELVVFWFVGIVAGLIAGLLGIGGGVIIVPSLLFILYKLGFEYSIVMSICVATSLSTMIITGLFSSYAHIKKKGFDFTTAFKLLPGLVLGCILGVLLSTALHGQILAKIFGLVVLALGVYLYFPKLPEFHFGTFSTGKKLIFSTSLGFVSALLGIGGGIVAVPILMGFDLSFRKSAALSSALTFLIALVSSVGYLMIGWNDVHITYSLGYIYLPAFFFHLSRNSYLFCLWC